MYKVCVAGTYVLEELLENKAMRCNPGELPWYTAATPGKNGRKGRIDRLKFIFFKKTHTHEVI